MTEQSQSRPSAPLPSEGNDRLVIALPKGRILKELAPLLQKAGIEPEPAFSDEDARQLRFRTSDPGLDIIRVRSFDVATFVAFGAAELGVAGNDVLMERLESDFPHEYDDFTDTVGRAAQSSGDGTQVIAAANGWLLRFFASHKRDFAAAPIATLDRVMELEQGFLEALRAHDEFACANYAKGQPQDQPLPEDLDRIGGEIVAARFAAIRAGREDQQLRLALTPEDYEAVEATLRAGGLNDEQVAVVFGASDPSSIGAPLACEMQIELVRAIRAQDLEERRALLIGSYVSGA